jgi:hypothetical protein
MQGILFDRHSLANPAARLRGLRSLSIFHQHIHVAFRAKVVSQNRSEKGEPADVVPLAEIRDFVLRNLQCHLLIHPSSLFFPPGDS